MPLVDDKKYVKVKCIKILQLRFLLLMTLGRKKYYRLIEVPKDADIETSKCRYRNGILRLTFNK